jgi:hypothetical protein
MELSSPLRKAREGELHGHAGTGFPPHQSLELFNFQEARGVGAAISVTDNQGLECPTRTSIDTDVLDRRGSQDAQAREGDPLDIAPAESLLRRGDEARARELALAALYDVGDLELTVTRNRAKAVVDSTT